MWEAHARATEARKNAPKRPSYLSVSVREWEAANASYEAANRTRSARADLHRVWNGMLAAMKAKLEAGELTVFGQEDPPFGPWHAIPAPAWRQLRITNVRKGEASVGANIVHDIHILPPDADATMRTGMPGCPTKGRDIIAYEFQRRAEAGEISDSLAAEPTGTSPVTTSARTYTTPRDSIKAPVLDELQPTPTLFLVRKRSSRRATPT